MKGYAEALRVLPGEDVSDNNPFIQKTIRFTPFLIPLLKSGEEVAGEKVVAAKLYRIASSYLF
jgi:hypothetical protein